MDRPIRSHMKVGLIHFMAYPSTIGGEGPILETLKKVLEDNGVPTFSYPEKAAQALAALYGFSKA